MGVAKKIGARLGFNNKATDARTFSTPVAQAGEAAAEIGAISGQLADELEQTGRKAQANRETLSGVAKELQAMKDSVEAARARTQKAATSAEDGAAATYHVVGTGGNADAKAAANLYGQQAEELSADEKALDRASDLIDRGLDHAKQLDEILSELGVPLERVGERMGEHQQKLGSVAAANATYVRPL